MININDKKSLILRVILIMSASLIFFSVMRVLIIHSDQLQSDTIYLLFIKEIIFSIISALIISLILYLITKKEIQKINTKALEYAFTDGLTGLYNRHYLNDFVKKFTLLENESSDFAVAFIDIDKFKDINDTMGHTTGDCILKCLALKLKSLTRTDDILCRYGGEEFIIIYSDISKEEIIKKMQHIRASVENMDFKCEHRRITVSIGLSIGKKGDDINRVMHESDIALYAAKEAGRNCVKIY